MSGPVNVFVLKAYNKMRINSSVVILSGTK
jgi:hypothetical protein